MKRSAPLKAMWLLSLILFLSCAVLIILNHNNPAVLIALLISGFFLFLSSVLAFGLGMRKTLDDHSRSSE